MMIKEKKNTNKQFSVYFFLLIFVALLWPHSSISQNLKNIPSTSSPKKIIVGGDNNFPPFEFLDQDGKPTGFTTDLTKTIAEKTNIQVEFKLLPWHKIFSAVEEGQIDIIQCISYSDKRAQKLDFSQPYLINHYIAVTNKKSNLGEINSIEQLKNLKVSVQNHDIAHETLKEKGYTNIFPEENMELALQGVLTNKYDCAVVSRLAALHFIEKNHWHNKFKLFPTPLLSVTYCYAVKKGNQEILSYFIDGLKLVGESGKHNELVRNWFTVKPQENILFDRLKKYLLPLLAITIFILLVIIAWNISLRKLLSAKIADLNIIENRYKQIFDGSRDGIVMVDPEAKIIDANPAFCRITGYSLDELKKMTFYEITPQKWHKWEKEEIWDKRLLIHGWTGIYEKEYITKDKKIIPIEVQAYTVFDKNHNPIYLWGVVRDMTERKKQEAEIQKRLNFEFLASRISSIAITSENITEFFRNTILTLSEKINTSSICSLIYDSSLNLVRVFFEWTAPGTPSIINFPLNIHITQLFPDHLKDKNHFIIASDLKEISKDSPFLSHLSDHGVKSLVAIPVFNANELFAYIILLEYRTKKVWDNIEIQTFNAVSKIATNAISKLKSEEKQSLLLTAIEHSEEVVVITNKSAIIEYVNPAFEKITGYSRDEAIGKTPRILKSGKQSKDFYSQLWKEISSGKTWQGRFINKKKDGSLYTEDAVISPVRDKSGNITHYIAIKRDITTQLKLEEQFLIAQKMESIGRLAGGIAHDFNNMLAVILGFCEIALAKVKNNSFDIEADLQQIHNAATRSADMTKHLLAFSRKQIVHPQPLDPNSEIEKLLTIIKRLIGENIKITWTPKEGLPQIYMDPIQLQQILINLCVNAKDAMDKPNPEIKISSDVKTFFLEFCKDNPEYSPGTFVEISCADNGHGMDSEIMKHMFEPFFTTKPAGKGTGLGLSIVYNVLKQNNGFITVKSTPGIGSIFSIYLPVFIQKKEVPSSSIPSKVNFEVTKEKPLIMIVEDEVELLKLCETVLGKYFTVIAANNAFDALQKLKHISAPLTLLLTDVIMPDMNGFELAKAVKSTYPEVKILFMSGYIDEYLTMHSLEETKSQLLNKPFTPDQLVEKVFEVLKAKETKETT